MKTPGGLFALSFLALGLLAWASLACAELPCVAPDDAVLVLDAHSASVIHSAQVRMGLLFGEHGLYADTKITCPPGKRVGLWIVSTGPAQQYIKNVIVTGCEVGIVVGEEARHQYVGQVSVKGARVGVCWHADNGFLIATHIEATEVGIAVSGEHMRIEGSHVHIPGGIGVQIQDEVACTCAGAV